MFYFCSKYGTFSIGIYNGGGYHAMEENTNKTVESRLTFRPFPQTIPGLQFSYNMIYGKGNTSLNPFRFRTDGDSQQPALHFWRWIPFLSKK